MKKGWGWGWGGGDGWIYTHVHIVTKPLWVFSLFSPLSPLSVLPALSSERSPCSPCSLLWALSPFPTYPIPHLPGHFSILCFLCHSCCYYPVLFLPPLILPHVHLLPALCSSCFPFTYIHITTHLPTLPFPYTFKNPAYNTYSILIYEALAG